MSTPKVYLVRFGVRMAQGDYLVARFYTDYHRDQFVRAMTLNGTPCEVVL